MSYRQQYKEEAATLIRHLPWCAAQCIAERTYSARRVFVVGMGGSAANASHMASDLCKLAGVDAFCPTDNVAEFTARANDDGWDVCLQSWLGARELGRPDLLLVLSVGGGSDTTSVPLVRAMECAREAGASVAAIVSRDGGKAAGLCSEGLYAFVPIGKALVTPLAESMQVLLCHYIANQVARWRDGDEGYPLGPRRSDPPACGPWRNESGRPI